MTRIRGLALAVIALVAITSLSMTALGIHSADGVQSTAWSPSGNPATDLAAMAILGAGSVCLLARRRRRN